MLCKELLHIKVRFEASRKIEQFFEIDTRIKHFREVPPKHANTYLYILRISPINLGETDFLVLLLSEKTLNIGHIQIFRFQSPFASVSFVSVNV